MATSPHSRPRRGRNRLRPLVWGGAAALLFLGSQFASLDSGLVAGGGIGWSGWVILALIPLLGAFVALLTARLTVLYLLRKIA